MNRRMTADKSQSVQRKALSIQSCARAVSGIQREKRFWHAIIIYAEYAFHSIASTQKTWRYIT